MDDPNLFMNRLELGMALAEQFKLNDFAIQSRIIWFMREVNRYERRHIFVIHRSDDLVEVDKEFNPGVVAYWLGDSSGKYVFVREHDGAKLSGMVAVQMYTTIVDDEAKIVLDIWPVSENDGTYAGTLWLTGGYQQFKSKGEAPIFAVERLAVNYPALSMGSLSGFCFGAVLFHELGLDSQVILGNMMERISAELGQGDPEKALPLLITPFGAARGQVKSEYPLTTKWLATRPDGMDEMQFKVLHFLFENGAKIVSQEEIYRYLTTKKGMTSDEAMDVIKVVFAAVKAGWLMRVDYAQNFYYVPTPKLYVALS